MKNLKLFALVLIAAAFLFAGNGCAPAYSLPYSSEAVSPVVLSSTQDARHTPLAIKHDTATVTRATPVTKPGSPADTANAAARGVRTALQQRQTGETAADNRSGSREGAGLLLNIVHERNVRVRIPPGGHHLFDHQGQ